MFDKISGIGIIGSSIGPVLLSWTYGYIIQYNLYYYKLPKTLGFPQNLKEHFRKNFFINLYPY